jgi:GcrA cell cycle regulator
MSKLGRRSPKGEYTPRDHYIEVTSQIISWNEDNTARLRELWDEGHPAAEIGRRLGITKNAVIGKAWRLDLPPRRVADSPNLVPSLAEILPRATDRCHWPLGKPGTASFRFCRQPVLAGKPYCAAHCRIAYVRPVPTALERDFL